MKVRIKSRFASAKETAHVLGVSESRFKVLERLAHSDSTVKFKSATISRAVGKDAGPQMRTYSEFARRASDSAKSKERVSSGKRRVGKKSRHSAKRRSRAKTAS